MNITIDEEWLDNNREEWGGWILREEGATYILETDVTAPRTAFALGADNITLDIQDKIITFGDEAEIRVPNFSFENWKRGWFDFSGNRYTKVETGCEYIKQECQVGDSAMTIPVVEPGKEYRIRSNKYFDLKAGHYYALAHWDIRRPAGTKLPKCSVRTQIGFLDPAKGPRRDKPGTTNYSIFLPEEDISGPVKFFITVPDDAEEAGFYRMDNVLLSYSRCHGITGRGSANHWNNPAPDLPVTSEYRRALYGFTLKSSKGSKIVQGGAGYGGCCINLRSSKQCNITGYVYMATHPRSVNDDMGKCIISKYAEDLTIEPTVRTNNRAIAITSRQAQVGYNHHGNTMLGNCNIGVNSIGGNQGAASIGLKKDNDGTLTVTGKGKVQTRFTNGFFLMINEGGPLSSTIVENVNVNNTQQAGQTKFGGRGIHWVGKPDASGVNIIRNCNIETQGLPLNQEYGASKDGYPLGGCYGIQVESSCKNLIIENNFVSVKGLSESAGYRLAGPKNYEKPLECTARNNTFEVLHDNPSQLGGLRAAVFKPGLIDGDKLPIQENNTFRFNDCLVNFGGNKGTIVFNNTKMEYINDGTTHESPYDIQWNGGGSVEFRNTDFLNQETKSWIMASGELNTRYMTSDVNVSYTEDCHLHFGSGVANTPVTIKDSQGNSHSYLTDNEGVISDKFTWFHVHAASGDARGKLGTTTYTNFNPFWIQPSGQPDVWWDLNQDNRNPLFNVETS